MAAFGSVLVALVFTGVTWRLERTRHVSQRLSGLMLALAGIALGAFALANLLVVEEPVHALAGSLGAVMIVGGVWRLRRAERDVERVLHPSREDHPRGH